MILNYILKINIKIVFGFIAGIISSSISSFIPLLYTQIINKILMNGMNEMNEIKYLLFNYFLCLISSSLFASIRGFIFTIYIEDLTNLIKNDIIKTYNKKNLLYFNKNSHQNIANILNQDAKIITEIVYTNTNVFFRDLAKFIIMSIILINKSGLLYFFIILLVLFHLILEYTYIKVFFHKMIENTDKILIEQNNIINDYIQKIDTYRTLNINIYNKWKINNDNYAKLRKRDGIIYSIKLLIFEYINEIFTILLIVIGLLLKINYNIIFIFISYKSSLFSIAENYNEIRLSIIRNKKSFNNINNFFNDTNNIIINGNYNPSNNNNNIIPKIIIKNLNFAYNENIIFNNYNLTIYNNIITGITGSSGKGKSTLIKILLGLYSYDGEITIDDINIKDFDYNYYYNNLISYVNQEPVLCNGSIYKNLISNLDEKNIDKELLNNLIEKLNIVNLNITNDNDINNDINILSGGEKQRLSICRAFLRKPKILILDEPTSSLDYENENKVLELIKELNDIYKITIIMVSHSNNALSICDKIVKL